MGVFGKSLKLIITDGNRRSPYLGAELHRSYDAQHGSKG